MTTMLWIILGAIVGYMIMMLAVGIFAAGKNKNAADFYLGGRGVGPLVTAMSAEASDMSSWLLMGLPAVALMGGYPEAVWTAIGLAIGTYLNWLFVAKRIRVYSEHVNAITVPEFFSKRFGDKKNLLTAVAALFIVIFFIPYTASGFAACGKLFSSLFGMDYTLAMLLSAAVIVIYCTLGGFLAASTTDLIQGIVMTISLFIVVGFGAGLAGGFGQVLSNVQALPGFTDLFRGFSVATGETESFGALKVISTLAWGLGYCGMPHILLRFMAIKDSNKLKTSRRIATSWVVISLAIAVFVGIIGYSLRQNGVLPSYASASAAETVIVDLAKVLGSYGYLPALIGGVIVAGILAATMSTADSQLLAAASGISQNLVQETLGIKLSQKAAMWLARGCVLAISAVSILLALDPASSIFRIVEFAWAGFGAVFGPVVLCALFWKRANKWGALAGMLAGGGTVFFWKFVIREHFAGTVLDLYELLPAFLVALIAIFTVSLLTKKPNEEITETFDNVKANI